MGVKQRVNKVFVFHGIVNPFTNHDVFFKTSCHALQIGFVGVLFAVSYGYTSSGETIDVKATPYGCNLGCKQCGDGHYGY